MFEAVRQIRVPAIRLRIVGAVACITSFALLGCNSSTAPTTSACDTLQNEIVRLGDEIAAGGGTPTKQQFCDLAKTTIEAMDAGCVNEADQPEGFSRQELTDAMVEQECSALAD